MLDTLIADHRQAAAGAGKFRFIDLFVGIGGLRRGFDDEGECVSLGVIAHTRQHDQERN